MLKTLYLALFSSVAVTGLIAAAPTNAVAGDDWDDYWEDYWDDHEDALEDRRERWDDRSWRVDRPYRFRGYSSGYYYAPPRYDYTSPPYYGGYYYYGPQTYRRVGPVRWEVWY